MDVNRLCTYLIDLDIINVKCVFEACILRMSSSPQVARPELVFCGSDVIMLVIMLFIPTSVGRMHLVQAQDHYILVTADKNAKSNP